MLHIHVLLVAPLGARYGSVKIISQISMQTLGGMKSAGNRGVLQSSFQVPHIHVLLVAPLRAGYMAQPGTDQHEGGVAIRERVHHPSAAADCHRQ